MHLRYRRMKALEGRSGRAASAIDVECSPERREPSKAGALRNKGKAVRRAFRGLQLTSPYRYSLLQYWLSGAIVQAFLTSY